MRWLSHTRRSGSDRPRRFNLGARKTGKLSPQALKRLVGWVVGASGVFMVGLAAPALLRRADAPAPPVRNPAPMEHLPDLRPEAPRPPDEPDDDPDDPDREP